MTKHYTTKAYTPYGQHRALFHLMMKLELITSFEYKHFMTAKFPNPPRPLRGPPKR